MLKPNVFNPEKKTGHNVSDRILLDCTGLEENPIRNDMVDQPLMVDSKTFIPNFEI
jgi:hypothetical protein